jgi:hypothetical protein
MTCCQCVPHSPLDLSCILVLVGVICTVTRKANLAACAARPPQAHGPRRSSGQGRVHARGTLQCEVREGRRQRRHERRVQRCSWASVASIVGRWERATSNMAVRLVVVGGGVAGLSLVDQVRPCTQLHASASYLCACSSSPSAQQHSWRSLSSQRQTWSRLPPTLHRSACSAAGGGGMHLTDTTEHVCAALEAGGGLHSARAARQRPVARHPCCSRRCGAC